MALACSHVDRLKQEDAAVGEVLAVAAQAEVERLREQVGLARQAEMVEAKSMMNPSRANGAVFVWWSSESTRQAEFGNS